ncbi:hypothetical protein DFH07DRAFT_947188 [Mycena maculata]|uniref:F-box domain-containing protein n=1 Tax=Mycena maculata TaxID=230809 RepID=A0AAD7HFG6_9AGAR|nr:hypothetical protein DFH07DRAFT_947188 [Mycena maculata]
MSLVGNIPELRQLIFSMAEKGDLAACAQVCTTWTKDALDIVWRELPSPLPIIRLVDEGSLSPTMTWQQGVPRATISPPVDWTRFRSFTIRIRKIHFPNSALVYALQKLTLVKALCPDLPLLPNLEETEVHASSDITWVPLVAMFLHSGVRRLVIHPSDGPSFFTYPNFFREVLLRAPSLESLEIKESSLLTFGRDWRPEDPVILAQYASQFPTLIRFAAPAVVLARLQNTPISLPKLRVLIETNALRPKVFIDHFRTHWPTPIARIRHLAISVTLTCASQLIAANPMSSLRILYLETFMSQPEQSHMQEFFRTLGNQCPGLEELTLMWLGLSWITTSTDNGEMDISVFEPLVDCTSLAVLDISAACALIFDEDGAERLAIILSNLRICRLTFIPFYGPIAEAHTLPSLAALLPFAFNCLRLEELSLVIDPTVPDTRDDLLGFSPVFRKLSIGHYVGGQGWASSAVAGFLAAVSSMEESGRDYRW